MPGRPVREPDGDGCDGCRDHATGSLGDPFVDLLEEDGPGEADGDGFVGNDAGDINAARLISLLRRSIGFIERSLAR